MNTFRDLLQDTTYDWIAYFKDIQTRPYLTSLEKALLRSYHQYTGAIEQCCCDTGPVKNCGPQCCNQVQCFHCKSTIRICKDAWFCHDNIVLCMRCKPRI
jgi:hypothetical protein